MYVKSVQYCIRGKNTVQYCTHSGALPEHDGHACAVQQDGPDEQLQRRVREDLAHAARPAPAACAQRTSTIHKVERQPHKRTRSLRLMLFHVLTTVSAIVINLHVQCTFSIVL